MRMAPSISPAMTLLVLGRGFAFMPTRRKLCGCGDSGAGRNKRSLYPLEGWLELFKTLWGLLGNLRKSTTWISLRFEKEHTISSFTDVKGAN
jgi:hypothetical protein